MSFWLEEATVDLALVDAPWLRGDANTDADTAANTEVATDADRECTTAAKTNKFNKRQVANPNASTNANITGAHHIDAGSSGANIANATSDANTDANRDATEKDHINIWGRQGTDRSSPVWEWWTSETAGRCIDVRTHPCGGPGPHFVVARYNGNGTWR